MAVSIVRGPDGRQHEVQHPEGIASSQIVKYAQRQIASSANAEDGFIVDVGKGLFAGGSQAAVSSAAGVTQWMGQSFGSDSLLQAAEDMRQFGQGVGDDIGLDEDFRQSFFGQVVQGLGQVPVTIGAGVAGFAVAGPVGAFGAAAITTGGQMSSEFLGDMEQTLGKGYTDFNSNEKANALTGMLAQTALGTTLEMAAIGKALRPLLKKMGTTGVSSKLLKKAIGKDRSALRELAEAAGAEGLTEAAQGQSLDTLASLLYDEDRELITFDTLKRRTMEFGVGAIVGGTVSGGAQLIGGAPSAPSGGKKADLKKPVQERSEVTIPDAVTVTYKPIDGPVKTVSLAIDPGQDRSLCGRSRTSWSVRYNVPNATLSTVSAPVPVGSEQELDLPDQAPDATQEDVPVQPEAAVVPTVVEAEAPAVEQAPVERVLPEVVPQVVPATEQAPAVRGNFRISPRMAKSKPRYRGQPVAYGSELELAVYMATAKGKNASKVRSELIEAGYSPAEINAMSEEVRAQMKKGYNPNSKKPISVAIAQDVTAEASGVDRRTLSFKDVTKRTPEIQEQAKILRENIKAGDREQSRAVAQAADDFKPVQSYDFVPAPESNSEMRNALNKDKVNKLNAPVKDGAPVAVRLDIPAYVSTGTWVPVVHEQTSSFRPGTPMSYQATAVVDGATLGIVSDIAVSGIAAGKAKSTIATIKGNLKKVTPTQAKKMAEKALKDPSYVQVGMDPERRGYFYNRETMQEVVAGDQAIQIGPLVLVKNPQYGATPSNEWLSLGPDVVAEAAQQNDTLPSDESPANIGNQSQYEKDNSKEQQSTEAQAGTIRGNSLFAQPLQDSAEISERYQGSTGLPVQEPRRIIELDQDQAQVIGKAYDEMKHDPTNPEVRRAYEALVQETLAQYDAILDAGYSMELSNVEYDNSPDMIDDLRSRKVMRIFPTEEGFGSKGISAKARRENPMLGDSGRTDKDGNPLLVNDVFRFVHDFFGHAKLGNGFGAIGEENAWNVHSLMFSPLAQRALASETRGQNAWVNFSGVNDAAFELRNKAREARKNGDTKEAKRLSKLAYSKMKFADQKIGLLPEEFSKSTYQDDVTAQATDTAVEDRGPRDTYDNGGQVQDAIEQEFDPIGKKINVKIVMRMKTDYVARYNATQGIIEYNPMLLLKRSKAGIRAAMREEIIHAAMHKVIMVSARKKFSMAEGGKGWTDFFGEFGKSLTDAERADIKDVYQNIDPEDYVGYGSEYSRAVIQNLLYGEFSEEYQMQSQGGPAWNTIVKLLRSVQAYMAKVLGPMIKTNPEAAQVIVDSVELLKAVDPSIRPKSQDVVAQAYDATDKNTAKENTEAGERVGKDSSERIREERKWFDGAFRKTASKYLTPVITRLNRIHPMFGRILQNLDTAIRTRSFKYRKQTEMFFNKLNAVKGAEFQELKQLIFFSPTPEEANLPSNKAKMQRRDALLHKHGLLNMYRLDVQPILEEIYTEYTALGMPKIGYLEDYFPRVIKDLEGLIKSYGHKTKRTFELLVNEENIRRSELKDKDGNPAPLPEMQETELGRFFQDFLQGKFRVDLNGVKLPGNVKAREIQLIPEDKLKFYDEPGVAFGKYTTNMARAIESFKVVGDTKKGEGRLLGSLGKLTEELFTAGEIDQVDANEVKSLTELITSQFQAENEILKSLGTLTYMATLINPGPVLVQIMDLYKVALYRGLGGVVSGTYRTVTGNRRFDIEEDFSIAKTQLSAEFEDPSVLQKALDFGLSRLVPFRQMDTAMKHASIEAAYDDFVKKSKAPVGSKKYQQLLDELTVTMGREDALKTISDLRLDKAMESPLVKEALLAELLQRQPLTYLQVPEGYQTDPSKRLFYKLSTFMLLDLNYNRQEFMNDLGGPGKTLKQRTVALRRLAYMATLLTMFGLPSDLLDDWISGKDTYIPEHVMNNMLGMFGLSRYTTSRALNKGAVESVIQRFTPPAINIMIDGEQSLRSWVKGDKELFDIKSWRNSPLSDVWYYRTGGGVESQRKYQKKQRKEGITPSIDR